jgi:hypothetical protein
MIKIIDYVEMCSVALLATFDQIERKYDANDRLYLELNKTNKEILQFNILSTIRGEYYHGYKNMIINTCRPYDNWRKDKSGKAIKAVKYSLNDEMLYIDKQKLEYFLDSLWKKLSKKLQYNYILLNNHRVDLIDMQHIVQEIVGVELINSSSYYHILKDSNIEYVHTGNIPKYILDEVEIELRRNNLII